MSKRACVPPRERKGRGEGEGLGDETGSKNPIAMVKIEKICILNFLGIHRMSKRFVGVMRGHVRSIIREEISKRIA